MENNFNQIGESLNNFQAALNSGGSNLEEFIKKNYVNKWLSDELYAAMAIRTTFIQTATGCLAGEGLCNLEKVMMSIITDPLAHDIEHTPSIPYKGQQYLTTHSMIYSKFLACSNPKIKGVYVDSPNIRLELESPTGEQRGKYIADFSQIDVEVKRNRNVELEEYYNQENKVLEILNEDMAKIKNLFEKIVYASVKKINEKNKDELKILGVVLEEPPIPFPAFLKDEYTTKYGAKIFEEKAGEETDSQFFWITGLLRENYDLIYPYLKADGTKVNLKNVPSRNIFNFDIIAKSIDAQTGKHSPAKEILSGAIREWLFEPIVERIIDNKVLPVKPVIKEGNIENINELGGYGPFLYFTQLKDSSGNRIFPDTMGGGIGVERTLYAILRGKKITKIDDITFFGKNPDSHPIYLY